MTASPRAVELAQAAAEAAADKQASDIVAFDVSDRLAITDAFVLAAGVNDRQVRAVVDAVEERLRTLDAKPVRREGQNEGRWVLLDFAEIVVHVQRAEEREYYTLERLWKDCPELPLGLADSIGAAGGEFDRSEVDRSAAVATADGR